MQVPFLDLKVQYAAIKSEIRRAIDEVCDNQQFILGPKVRRLEDEIARYCGARYAVGVSSGTDALLLALMALGIGPGDEVITTPYTFIATAGSIARSGAKPVFVDIDPACFTIDPKLIADRITERTRAILPVHLFGRCAEMEPILRLAAEHQIAVIEDAAQALGAEDGLGRRAGHMGVLGCFSFYPTKNLGGFGDGGMVITSDSSLASTLIALRNHGSSTKYHHSLIGGNFRLDELQAATLTVKLQHLDRWTEQRITNAARYDALFRARDLDRRIQLPELPKNERHVFNQYVIRAPRRDKLSQFLESRGIGHDIYYPLPLHLQACFESLGYKEGDMPASEQAAKEALALPIYPELMQPMQEYVVDAFHAFYRERSS
ncbi:DegT/DnrJ/EryC1/StrS family aminotransferase [Candidatus Methylomirabilis sp.]|uniref:DegT/DnrJ/EryC1/StrS family aminotransferase n=1 Tax=Candidatus Methylomirabilis sp. TaxID=2032687 RepID=UPI002A62E586|nr:DegT/DnrJ/EryC1/StrS family aminotransferase [Candidatus Methylomirabilis sp.]